MYRSTQVGCTGMATQAWHVPCAISTSLQVELQALLAASPATSAHHLLRPAPLFTRRTCACCLTSQPSPPLVSQGYLRAVEALRDRLMASEWELGLRPIALQL